MESYYEQQEKNRSVLMRANVSLVAALDQCRSRSWEYVRGPGRAQSPAEALHTVVSNSFGFMMTTIIEKAPWYFRGRSSFVIDTSYALSGNTGRLSVRVYSGSSDFNEVITARLDTPWDIMLALGGFAENVTHHRFILASVIYSLDSINHYANEGDKVSRINTHAQARRQRGMKWGITHDVAVTIEGPEDIRESIFRPPSTKVMTSSYALAKAAGDTGKFEQTGRLPT